MLVEFTADAHPHIFCHSLSFIWRETVVRGFLLFVTDCQFVKLQTIALIYLVTSYPII